MGTPWTGREDATLVRMLADGCAADDVADALGRTRAAVHHRSRKVAAGGRRGGLPDVEARARVLDLLDGGHTTARAVAAEVGRTPRAVSALLSRMRRDGLVDRSPCDRVPRWRTTARWRSESDPEPIPQGVVMPEMFPKAIRRPFVGPYHPVQHRRTRAHLGGYCFSFRPTTFDEAGRKAGGLPVKWILTEYDETPVYEWWGDFRMLEDMHEEDGTTYYLLECETWLRKGDPRIRRC